MDRYFFPLPPPRKFTRCKDQLLRIIKDDKRVKSRAFSHLSRSNEFEIEREIYLDRMNLKLKGNNMREGKKRIMEREAKSLRRKREGGEMRKRRKKRKEESGGELTEAMSSNLHNASSFDNYTHSARYRCAVFIWLCAHER